MPTTTTLDPSLFATWQWTDWNSYGDDCLQLYKHRQRTCFQGQECVGQSEQFDVNNFDEDALGSYYYLQQRKCVSMID